MPGRTSGRYEQVWAFVSDEGDREGVVGGIVGGIATPFITGDPEHRERFREAAILVGKATGKQIRMVRFVRAEEEVVTSGPRRD